MFSSNWKSHRDWSPFPRAFRSQYPSTPLSAIGSRYWYNCISFIHRTEYKRIIH